MVQGTIAKLRVSFLVIVFFCLYVASFTYAQNSVKKPQTSARSESVFLRLPYQAKGSKSTDDLLRQHLLLNQQNNFLKLEEKEDNIGFSQEKYQQYYKNIRVEYGIFKIHKKNNVPQFISGAQFNISEIDLIPTLSEQAALKKALSFVNAKVYKWEIESEEKWLKTQDPSATYFPKGELVICKVFLNQKESNADEMALAYKFDIYAHEPLSRGYIYVDARNGRIIHQNAIIKHVNGAGTAATRYSGSRAINTEKYESVYRLRDLTRGTGIETYNMKGGISYALATDFTDNDNNWTGAEHANLQKDDAALDAHWGAMMTYDYFKSAHGRNGFDGNGAKIKNYVHYSTNFINAFWDGYVMSYGDGGAIGKISVQPLTSLDVAAHEIGHALCQHTANLVYANEPGALNEGFSDIWGASVEYYNAPAKDTWSIGEDMNYTIRSMSNPNAFEQPDTYLGNFWYSGNGDFGGVHINSGVLNYWYYLLCVGKSDVNDHGDNYTVTGIGMDKASKIAYRTETVYLTANSQYADARKFSIQAAIDLYGAGSVEAIQTANAWFAVGVYDKETAPSNLTARALSATQINLSWQDNASNETGFSIERSTTSGDSFVQIATVGANVTSYEDKNLTTDAVYFYRVAALNNSIHSAYSNETSITLGNAPIIMSNRIITTCQATILDPGGVGYYKDNQHIIMTLVPATPGAAISVSFFYFEVEYHFDYLKVYDGATIQSPLLGVFNGNAIPPALTATNPSGQLTFEFYTDGSTTMAGWEAVVSCVTIPLAPSNLTATGLSATQIKLNWQDNASGETGFKIERSTASGSNFVQIATVGANVTSYEDKNLTTDATYFYRVRTYKHTLHSEYSNEARETVGIQPTIMNTTTLTTCKAIVLDPGGNGNYSNNLNVVMTFTPVVAGNKINISFSSFITEAGYDKLLIYDGATTSAPLVGTFSGSTLPAAFTATNTTGQLTLRFTTDGSSVKEGWQAIISCVAVPTISNFSPESGYKGIAVKITGTNFTGVKAVNFFNNVPASFIVNSDTEITATIPEAATTGPISVTSSDGTATSVGALAIKSEAFISLSNLNQTYNGANTVSVSTLPVNLPVILTYNGVTAVPVNAGKYVVTTTINSPVYYGSATDTLVISKAAAAIAISNLSHTYDGTAKLAKVSSNFSGIPVKITYNGSSVAPINVGSYAVVAAVDHLNYHGAANGILTIDKASQVIDFFHLNDKVLGDTPFNLTASSSSGLPVEFSLVSGPAFINGNILTLTGAGQVIVRASQKGNSSYQEAPIVEQQFKVNIPSKLDQVLTFSGIEDKNLGDAPFMLKASASSQLPVTYTIISGPALIAGNILTLTGAGRVMLRAIQTGNDTFNAASPVDQTFCVKPAKPFISFSESSTSAKFVLKSSSALGNQWLRDGKIIEGATSQTYAVIQEGNYAVQVSIEGCNTISDEVTLTGESITEAAAQIRIYPNPTAERIFINYQANNLSQEIHMVIFNTLGMKVSEKVLSNMGGQFEGMFEVGHLVSGRYFIRISDKGRTYTKSFVKL